MQNPAHCMYATDADAIHNGREMAVAAWERSITLYSRTVKI